MPRHIDVLRSNRNSASKAGPKPSTQAVGKDESEELSELPFPSEKGSAPEKVAEPPAQGLDAFSEEERPQKAAAPPEEMPGEAKPHAELPHDLDELVCEQPDETVEEIMQDISSQDLQNIPSEQMRQAIGEALGKQSPETLHELAPKKNEADIERIVNKLLPQVLRDFTEKETEKALEEVVEKILRGALKELTEAHMPKTEAATASSPITTPETAPPIKEAAPPPKEPPSPSKKMETEEPVLVDVKGWISQLARLVLAAFRAAAANKPKDLSPLVEHIRILAAAKHNSALIDELELHLGALREQIQRADANLGDLVVKGITVMLYGLKISGRLQLSTQVTISLMLAGLLHHIGMAMLPASIRQKKGNLSDEERRMLRDVPKLGAQFLRRCGIEDKDALAATRYWRERFDGSGPEGMKGRAIPLMARIIGLLTAFEALIHFRPYRKRLLPMEAVSLMIKQSRKEFDPELLKALIESLSLYPVGSYVQLNSGDIGQVLAVNPKLPLRPKIRLILNRLGQEIEPREVNLVEQPNLIIRRCVYEEELEDLKTKAELEE